MKINPGRGSRPCICKRKNRVTAEDSRAPGTVQTGGEGGHTGVKIREQLILWYQNHAELSWERDTLKNNLGPGMSVPPRQPVGFLAAVGLHIPRPEEANTPILILNVFDVLCCGMPPRSDCHLDEHMLGVNFHYVFIWWMQVIWSYFKKKKGGGQGWGGTIA